MAEEILWTGRTKSGKEFVVRKYQPQDRARTRWICSETGFIGKPQEAVFIGREVFADLWSKYWTDYEPENALVAEVEGQVEGYLLGCLDSARQEKIWNKEILPGVARRLLLPSWWKHQKNRKFIRAWVRSNRLGEFKVPKDELFKTHPAHLHTNIGDPAFRGQGLGKALMLVYFDHLRRHNLSGLHLGTTDHNREAIPFYHYMGFKVLHKNRLTLYDHAIDDPPMYLLYLGKYL